MGACPLEICKNLEPLGLAERDVKLLQHFHKLSPKEALVVFVEISCCQLGTTSSPQGALLGLLHKVLGQWCFAAVRLFITVKVIASTSQDTFMAATTFRPRDAL